MKAYKVFNPDWTCRGFKYEIGKEYKIKGKPILCKKGFHACRKVSDCFSYYSFDTTNKVAEVELLGDIVGVEEDKLCTNHIKIVRELSWAEMLEIANSGNGNSGNGNSGNWNSGNGNSGIFNTDEPFIRMFNKQTKLKRRDIDIPLFLYFDLTSFISYDYATEEERVKYKNEIETCGGFLRTLSYKEAFSRAWRNASDEERDKVKNLPNFDADIFFEISGIKVS